MVRTYSEGGLPKWLWVGLLFIQLFFIGWSIWQRSWVFPDSDRYAMAAQNLWQHGELYARLWPQTPPMGQAVQEFTIRPPVYPLFALLLGGGSLDRAPILLLLVQNLLSFANVLVIVGIWARYAKPTKMAWLWVSLLLFFPAQVVYANTLMSEILLQTLLVLMAAGGVLYWRTKQLRYAAGVAAGVALAMLLKPVFYPFAGIIALLGLAIWLYTKRVAVVLLGMVPLAVAILYMGWNYYRTGYTQFSSISTINLLHYNAAGVVRQLEGPAREARWVAGVLQEAGAQPTFALRQETIQARAGAVLLAHPIIYARQHVQGMLAFFLDPGRFDIAQFFHIAPPSGGGLLEQLRASGSVGLLTAAGQLPWGLLLLLGLGLAANLARLGLAIRGFWLLRKAGPNWRAGRWWLALLILYLAFLTGPLGAARFLVPVWPLLLLLALCGLKPFGPMLQQAAPMSEDLG